MQKAEAQHKHTQSQPTVRQGKGASLESPQGEQIAQLEAMADNSPQAAKPAQLAAMANSSPQAAVQHRMMDSIHNSPHMAAQRKAVDSIHTSPHVTAQRRRLASINEKAAQGADNHAEPHALVQLSPGGRREADDEGQGPGQGGAAPLTPRPGQGGQMPAAQSDSESQIQGGFSPREVGAEERDETAQLMKGNASQSGIAQREEAPAKPNNTGLPDNLKSGIESLSGMSMDNVRVHYNSSQPAQLNALAYAQGTDIHVAPGQEQHLPHEAWHVVQQAQGRVRPTMQMKEGVPVNDDKALEHEADVMGARAVSVSVAQGKINEPAPIDSWRPNKASHNVAQQKAKIMSRPLGQKPGDKSKDWGLGIGNLKLNHRHIGFDQIHDLPVVGDQNNIGFHDNALFSEDVANLGYEVTREYDKEGEIVAGVYMNQNPGTYNVVSNNCQDWVTKVEQSAQSIPDIQGTSSEPLLLETWLTK